MKVAINVNTAITRKICGISIPMVKRMLVPTADNTINSESDTFEHAITPAMRDSFVRLWMMA